MQEMTEQDYAQDQLLKDSFLCLNVFNISVTVLVTVMMETFLFFVPQTSSEVHIMYRQPWYPSPSTRAVPHTPTTERGVYPTPAGQVKGNHYHSARQVRHCD